MVGRYSFPGTAAHVSAFVIVGELDVRLILAEFAATVITISYIQDLPFRKGDRLTIVSASQVSDHCVACGCH